MRDDRGLWLGWGLGDWSHNPDGSDRDPTVRRFKAFARRMYASYMGHLADSNHFNQELKDAVTELQRRLMAGGRLPPAGFHPGVLDAETQHASGFTKTPNGANPHPQPAVAYSVPGTGGIWNYGPTWWTCERLDPTRFYTQGVGYNTSAFIIPDPSHSYVEARNEGVDEMLRLALPDPRPKIPIGYSMGADVVTRFLIAWPAERRGEIVAVIKFGDPGHLPGVQGSVNGGISRVFTPDWAADITTSYQIDGDMYGDAPGILPALYELLTRMEASPEFAGYLFGWLTGIPIFGGQTGFKQAAPSPMGAGLLGLAGGMSGAGFGALAPILGLVTPGPAAQTSGPVSLPDILLNWPGIIQALMTALHFLFTGAHNKYGGSESLPIFHGVDAVIDSADRINSLRPR